MCTINNILPRCSCFIPSTPSPDTCLHKYVTKCSCSRVHACGAFLLRNDIRDHMCLRSARTDKLMPTRVATSLPHLIPCLNYIPTEAAYGGLLKAKSYQEFSIPYPRYLPNFTAAIRHGVPYISLTSTTYTYRHF